MEACLSFDELESNGSPYTRLVGVGFGEAYLPETPKALQRASTQCEEVITDPLTERCVEKVGQDLMTDANPPGYSLRSYNCQDWATEAFRRCGLNRYYQEFPRIRRTPSLPEISITP